MACEKSDLLGSGGHTLRHAEANHGAGCSSDLRERRCAIMNILFITATRIGDAVLSTGLLAHLVERYPGAAVTIAAGPVAAPLFEAVPGLARRIVLEKRRWSGHWLMLWRATVATRWDLVV